jgi:hypothetical protein
MAPFTTRDEFVANLPGAVIGGALSPFYVHVFSTIAKRRKKFAKWRADRRARVAGMTN